MELVFIFNLSKLHAIHVILFYLPYDKGIKVPLTLSRFSSLRATQDMEVTKPSANMGARVDGGASGATSQLTQSKEATHEQKYCDVVCSSLSSRWIQPLS